MTPPHSASQSIVLRSNEEERWSGYPFAGMVWIPPLDMPCVILFLVGYALMMSAIVMALIYSEMPRFFLVAAIIYLHIIVGYLTLGRFYLNSMIRRGTRYVLTNQRIRILVTFWGRSWFREVELRDIENVTVHAYNESLGHIFFGDENQEDLWKRTLVNIMSNTPRELGLDFVPDAERIAERIRHAIAEAR